MRFVVVESPTKAKTLGKFLGKDYLVEASFGHVKDLPKKELGVDTEHDFAPTYITPPKAKKTLAKLKKEAQGAEEVYLATDPDREGEAIAWHVAEELGGGKDPGSWKVDRGQKAAKKFSESTNYNLRSTDFKRVVFHEITPEAVQDAFAHPRQLDENLFNAQQARRVLDRLVGYKLSPLLWKKIRYGLSAGRVQSVALRLVVEREREREQFRPEEYWTVAVLLQRSDLGKVRPSREENFWAKVVSRQEKKLEIKEGKAAAVIVEELSQQKYRVAQVEKQERRKEPYPPFTTSTLQQAAVNLFGFSGTRTMRAAQGLYEKGLITYHRTDSLNLAVSALNQIREVVTQRFGRDYLPERPRFYKTKSRLAQEAHEAIRPTHPPNDLKSLPESLGADEAKLYDLIWRRALSCQMKPALYEVTTAAITAGPYKLKAKGSRLLFEGFYRVNGDNQTRRVNGVRPFGSTVGGGREEEDGDILPPLTVGEALRFLQAKPEQHFTEPPARYTEATLIKELEEKGIGRPSTYAPTMATLLERGYVNKGGRALIPEDLGRVVNGLLVGNFEEIVDVNFTAKMEEDLDGVATGEKKWVPLLQDFYTPFARKLEEKEEVLKKADFTVLGQTQEKCPECGGFLVKKLGKYGTFLSCENFPQCKFGKPLEVEGNKPEGLNDKTLRVEVDQTQLEGKCPQDGGELVLKVGRFGKFIACKNYPQCKFTKPYLDKIGMKCPRCGEGEVIVKRGKFKKNFFGCSRYPECKFTSSRDPREKEGVLEQGGEGEA